MTIQIQDKTYTMRWEENETTQDLRAHLPLDLELSRYAGHEYYASLPFKPVFAEKKTSHIEAGHVYYWDGWNAFVINFEDMDISPYQVVPVGEILEKDVVPDLQKADQSVRVQVH